MDSHRDEYTINPETGKQIKIGGPTWKRLAAKYYRVGDTFTDQTMPDTRAYLSNKVLGVKQVTPKRRVTHRRVSDPHGTSGTSSMSGMDMNSVTSDNVTYPVI